MPDRELYAGEVSKITFALVWLHNREPTELATGLQAMAMWMVLAPRATAGADTLRMKQEDEIILLFP